MFSILRASCGSQELLEAVERERRIRVTPPRNATIFHHPTLGDFELQHVRSLSLVGICFISLEKLDLKPQGVGSSGKDLGLCGSPMKSKVRIPLGVNNFLGPAKPEYYSIRVEGAIYTDLKFT
jgi:hypothetical protein